LRNIGLIKQVRSRVFPKIMPQFLHEANPIIPGEPFAPDVMKSPLPR